VCVFEFVAIQSKCRTFKRTRTHLCIFAKSVVSHLAAERRYCIELVCEQVVNVSIVEELLILLLLLRSPVSTAATYGRVVCGCSHVARRRLARACVTHTLLLSLRLLVAAAGGRAAGIIVRWTLISCASNPGESTTASHGLCFGGIRALEFTELLLVVVVLMAQILADRHQVSQALEIIGVFLVDLLIPSDWNRVGHTITTLQISVCKKTESMNSGIRL
jgi:hypothetical protein